NDSLGGGRPNCSGARSALSAYRGFLRHRDARPLESGGRHRLESGPEDKGFPGILASEGTNEASSAV
ncbi:MAG: hypothetical protein ACFFGP_02670, partial [Promethearchaeota archaeon]